MIDPKSIRKLDLQTLHSLVTLISERSVSRAAERMNISQPAMSAALAKLRGVLHDPLLVRTARGMEPTEHAVRIVQAIRNHLSGIDAILGEREIFDPATTEGSIRIATADSNALALFPALTQHMRATAPKLRLVAVHPDFSHIREWLEEGACDLVIGFFPDLPHGLRSIQLFSEQHRCVVSRDHPRIRDVPTLAQYVAEAHVGFNSPFAAIPTGDTALNEALAAVGLERRYGAMIPSPLLAGHLVAASDMITSVGSGLAQYFASILPVTNYPLPFEASTLHISMTWHDRSQHNPLQQWIRNLIRDIASGQMPHPAGG